MNYKQRKGDVKVKKTVVILLVAIMTLGTVGIAFADASWGPAAILADIKDVGVDEAIEMKSEGETFGGLLSDEPELYQEFKNRAMAQKLAVIEEKVTAGEISREEADFAIAALADCEGEALKGSGLFGQKAQDDSGNGIRVMDGEGEGRQLKQGGNGQGQQKGIGQMRRGN